jgi:hypothetical protein
MGTKESAQPDPMGDILNADVDKLLDQTSALAAKASREVGLSPQPVPSAPAAPDKGAAPEPVEGDVDGQLAELEALLNSTVPAAQPPAGVPSSRAESNTPTIESPAEFVSEEHPNLHMPVHGSSVEATAPQPPAATDFDDFDISVDLSDHKEVADQEIAEKLAAPVTEGTEAGDLAGDDEVPTRLERVLGLPLRLLESLMIALDRPFAGLPVRAKQFMGYIAIATLIVAFTGLAMGSLNRH